MARFAATTMTELIPMVDLKGQYLNIKTEVDQAIADVINTTSFINGSIVQEFSKNLENYLGGTHVIPCANGTDALQIAMMGLGLKPGDEVITPSFTYIATVEVVALLGLTPVFVDVDPETFTINPEEVRKVITSKTKAIVPVHLYGHSAPMEEILKIAQEHNLFVIEDNAQAIGGHYIFSDGTRKANGTMGTIGTTSFFPSKNLGCYGDGGALYTSDEALSHTLKMIANHGQSKRYYHDIVGCNSRLDSIQAAVLNVKLKHLDAYCDARRKVAYRYNEAFADHAQITTPQEASFTKHVYHQYTLKVEGVDRDALVAELAANNVSSMIYYPVPAHKQKMFATLNLTERALPITDELTPKVISLPIHTEMKAETQDYIIEQFIKAIKKLS